MLSTATSPVHLLHHHLLASALLLLLLPFFTRCSVEEQRQNQELPLHCADFNALPAYAVQHGVDGKDVFVCPADGIASVKCNGSLPVQEAAAMHAYDPAVALTWDDVLVLMLYGKDFKGREKVVDWWAGLFRTDYPAARLDFVIVGPSCNVDYCADGAQIIATHLNETYAPQLAVTFIRGRPPEDGKVGRPFGCSLARTPFPVLTHKYTHLR